MIIDYSENKTEVDKWIGLKGEQKYLQFAEILRRHNISITWQAISGLYRYDKRLLINIFKYLSFFEEFLRAQVWNTSMFGYKKLEDWYLNDAIDKVIELKSQIVFPGFSTDILIVNREYINYLRNRISHNKIMLGSKKEEKNLQELLLAFYLTLPESYRKGFISDINNCSIGLDIPQQIAITI